MNFKLYITEGIGTIGDTLDQTSTRVVEDMTRRYGGATCYAAMGYYLNSFDNIDAEQVVIIEVFAKPGMYIETECMFIENYMKALVYGGLDECGMIVVNQSVRYIKNTRFSE